MCRAVGGGARGGAAPAGSAGWLGLAERNAELGERLQQAVVEAEVEAGRGVASGHKDAHAGLRTTLEQLLRLPPRIKGKAEEAQSCCFERERKEARGANSVNL